MITPGLLQHSVARDARPFGMVERRQRDAALTRLPSVLRTSWHLISVAESRLFLTRTNSLRNMNRREFQRILQAGLRGAMPLLVVATSSAAAQHVRIRVTDDVDESPIPDAVISLLNNGSSVHANAAGVIVVAAARAGLNVFTIRKLGYRPITTTLDVPAHDTLRVHVIMSATPTALDTVTVIGRNMASRFGLFEAHRRGNPGAHFITRQQIDSQRPIETLDLLRSMPGFRVVRPPTAGPQSSNQPEARRAPAQWGCWATSYKVRYRVIRESALTASCLVLTFQSTTSRRRRFTASRSTMARALCRRSISRVSRSVAHAA